jgi:hypothetical protein
VGCAIAVCAIAMTATPTAAAAENERPALVTFAASASTVAESPNGGFDITMGELSPLAAYSESPRLVHSGDRIPVDYATPLADREGIDAILLRPDAPRSENELLVELTDTHVTADGGFTAHATPVKTADEPLLERAAKGVDERLDEAPAFMQVTVADPEGEMADVVPAPRATGVVDTDYEVVSNNIFNFTPLPQKLVYTPNGGGTCVKDFTTRHTEDFTDNWITLRGFTVDSKFGCWFEVSKASYTVSVGDKTLNLDVEQESVTNSNFKVTRCDGAGLICKGSSGFHQFTINIFTA